jgi:hypothetical protein
MFKIKRECFRCRGLSIPHPRCQLCKGSRVYQTSVWSFMRDLYRGIPDWAQIILTVLFWGTIFIGGIIGLFKWIDPEFDSIETVQIDGCNYVVYKGYKQGGLTHAGNCPNPIHTAER